MKKFLFLSSAFIMTTLGAFGADGTITGGANTCTVEVLGVHENDAIANTIATWTLNKYNLTPGQYLNVTETSVDSAVCPAGSYCVGGEYTVENASGSVASCPTNYPSSDAGAGAQTQCYTACTVANANIAHATAVGGNDYFGDGADACYATACDTGYHVDGDVELVEETPVIPVDYTLAGNDYEYIAQGGTADSNDTAVGLSAQNTYAVDYDYGRVYGRASCQPSTDPAIEFIMANQNAILGGSMTIEEFKSGLEPLAGVVKSDYMASILTDVMNGTKDPEEMYRGLTGLFMISSDANYSTNSTGRYCYCQTDGFTPIGGDKVIVASAPWVFNGGGHISADDCASDCANYCAGGQTRNDMAGRALRAAVFGALGYTETGTCAANTINIDWNPDNGGEHIKNMCTYDGSVTLPTPDPVKPGYTFTGWKLLENTTTE